MRVVELKTNELAGEVKKENQLRLSAEISK